jgi:hypothetical protein
MPFSSICGLAGAFAGIVAAVLWLRSSMIHIRDNQDKFMEDLHTMERANFLAVIATAIAAALVPMAEIFRAVG